MDNLKGNVTVNEDNIKKLFTQIAELQRKIIVRKIHKIQEEGDKAQPIDINPLIQAFEQKLKIINDLLGQNHGRTEKEVGDEKYTGAASTNGASGGASESKYYQKYLKYKTKYHNLKSTF